MESYAIYDRSSCGLNISIIEHLKLYQVRASCVFVIHRRDDTNDDRGFSTQFENTESEILCGFCCDDPPYPITSFLWTLGCRLSGNMVCKSDLCTYVDLEKEKVGDRFGGERQRLAFIQEMTLGCASLEVK